MIPFNRQHTTTCRNSISFISLIARTYRRTFLRDPLLPFKVNGVDDPTSQRFHVSSRWTTSSAQSLIHLIRILASIRSPKMSQRNLRSLSSTFSPYIMSLSTTNIVAIEISRWVSSLLHPLISPLDNSVIVGNGNCASTCAMFSTLMFEHHKTKIAIFGGKPGEEMEYKGEHTDRISHHRPPF